MNSRKVIFVIGLKKMFKEFKELKNIDFDLDTKIYKFFHIQMVWYKFCNHDEIKLIESHSSSQWSFMVQ